MWVMICVTDLHAKDVLIAFLKSQWAPEIVEAHLVCSQRSTHVGTWYPPVKIAEGANGQLVTSRMFDKVVFV
eukprot:532308-Amphidinium_carterae.1